MKCPACEFENKAGVKFCVNCGEELPEMGGQEMAGRLFCPHCGRENPSGSRFCQSCGNEIIMPAVSGVPIPHGAPSEQVTRPGLPERRTPGWIWGLISGLVVVIVGAGLLYALKAKQDQAVSRNAGPMGGDSESSPVIGSCRSAEKTLYLEDFEDGTAEDWIEIEQEPPFFSVGPAFDDADNLAMVVQKSDSISGQVHALPKLDIPPFSNAVLRMRFYIDSTLPADDTDWFSFNWIIAMSPFTLEGQQVFDSRYQLPIGSNYFEMRRLQQPLTNESADRSVNPAFKEWHSLEIATYQPRTTVWVDGAKVMEYEDPNPLPEGTFGLEAWLTNPEAKLFFDDIAICELTGSYQP